MGNEHSKNKEHTKDKTEQALEKHQNAGLNNHPVSLSSDGLENGVTSEAAVEENSKPPSLPHSEEPGIVEANGSGRAPVVVEQEPVIEKVPEAEPETAKTETTQEPEPNPQKKEPKESSKEKVNIFDNIFKKKAKPQPIPNPDPAPEKEETIKEKTVEESSLEVPGTVTDGIHTETSEVLMAAHLFPAQLPVRFSFLEAEPELSSLKDFLTADGIQVTTENSEEQPVTTEEKLTDESVSLPEEETSKLAFGEEVTEDRTVEKSPVPKEELEEIAAIDSVIAAELEELKRIADILEDVAAIESEELEYSPNAKDTTEEHKKNDEGKKTSDLSSRLLGQLQSSCMKIIKESVYSPIRVSAEMSTESCSTVNITLKVSLRQREDLKCDDETAAGTALDLE